MDIELITGLIVDALRGKLNVPVGVSGRHVHLAEEHVEILFGPGYRLTRKKELMGGQYAAEEVVTIISQKLRGIENVRVLGPPRKQTQVEISATDAIRLGISAPLRESGNISGSAPISIAGPKGTLHLNEGCILAARHIHMPPGGLGYQDGDTVSVKVGGERGLVFNNVKIRVDPSFTVEMHIDTDEANAFGITGKSFARIWR